MDPFRYSNSYSDEDTGGKKNQIIIGHYDLTQGKFSIFFSTLLGFEGRSCVDIHLFISWQVAPLELS